MSKSPIISLVEKRQNVNREASAGTAGTVSTVGNMASALAGMLEASRRRLGESFDDRWPAVALEMAEAVVQALAEEAGGRRLLLSTGPDGRFRARLLPTLAREAQRVQ